MSEKPKTNTEWMAVKNPEVMQPIKVIEDFHYSENTGMYTPPFATEDEIWGFLSGSESTVLCTKKDTIVSRRFVQCSGALIRNRDTGLISLIHQSLWSSAAQNILTLQRAHDLDVITMQGPIGLMRFGTIQNAHEIAQPNDRDVFVKEGDKYSGGIFAYEKHDPRHNLLRDGSFIYGLTEKEIEAMYADSARGKVGETNWVGSITLPGSRENALWTMMYRPKENVIQIYALSTNRLYFFKGFDLKK